jgi:hypothetical protein
LYQGTKNDALAKKICLPSILGFFDTDSDTVPDGLVLPGTSPPNPDGVAKLNTLSIRRCGYSTVPGIPKSGR